MILFEAEYSFGLKYKHKDILHTTIITVFIRLQT